MSDMSLAPMTLSLGGYKKAVQQRIVELDADRFVPRLWQRDPDLWKSESEEGTREPPALGWLDVAATMQTMVWDLSAFLQELLDDGFTRVVHMGMGGSSMAPLMFTRVAKPAVPALQLVVLDTSDPAAILAVEKEAALERTFFIEASKSGGTAETRAMGEYFFKRVKDSLGDRAGGNFGVITDQGSLLHMLSEERGYRKQFLGFSDIGGRYSALSNFGLVPAVLAGCDVPTILEYAVLMTKACGGDVPAAQNPGVVLGCVMGELARQGVDKLTFLVPEDLGSLGLWLEQLIAESTGKKGKGILPVAAEQAARPSDYGKDRLFVQIRLRDEPDAAIEQRVEALRKAGRPLVVFTLDDRLAMGAEIVRWEIATAAAGAILDIDPFDQPDVQASKDYTTRVLLDLGETGILEEGSPTLSGGSLSLFGDIAAPGLAEALAGFVKECPDNGYIALLAYLEENSAVDEALHRIRDLLFSRLHRAVTLGFGPRYLHSTGQYHKGGPDRGIFLILTADDKGDALIPTQIYTFGTLKRAQALGDMEALRKCGRPAVQVHLGSDITAGLEELTAIFEKA